MRRAKHAAALALIAGLAAAGCKDGDTLPDVFDPATADFVTEEPDVTTDYVTLAPVSTDGGRIRLAVTAHAVAEPLSGLALKLSYPVAFSKFVGCTDGTLFPPGTCYASEPDPRAGEIFVGRSVTGQGQEVAVPDSASIVELEFLVFGHGSGAVVIEGQNLGGGDASALLDANGDPVFVHWFAGVLVGQ